MSTQAMHSAIQWQHEHPECAKDWYINSNYLCFLSVANEQELISLIEVLKNTDIKYSVFKEPDINNEVTSIAIAPGNKSKKLCSKLKLALSEENTMSLVK